jgi:hypothetical protein
MYTYILYSNPYMYTYILYSNPYMYTYILYSNPISYRVSDIHSAVKKWSYPRGDTLVVLYYISDSEIWPDKRVGLWCEVHYQKGTTVVSINGNFFWYLVTLDVHIIHYSAIGKSYCTFAVVRFTGMTLVRK